ncbi:MAG TPA: DUF2851 family protein [Bacteroidota bacterium]|nr:DUF2851 family protein [Bacteroidota bacterium]
MPRRNTRESTLRDIWQRQAFTHFPLLTEEGKRVSVRFPGVPNADGGPDFTDARIRIGGVRSRGDVELHTEAASWHAHGHDGDPHYNCVILHAVLRRGRTGKNPRTASGRAVPQVVLAPFVDMDLLHTRPRRERETCRVKGARHSRGQLLLRLRKLGKRKIDARVRALGIRLCQIEEEKTARGWDQLLYESLMEGMGYSRNRLPFLTLARTVPLESLAPLALRDPVSAEALLFGEAGLLPPAWRVPEKESRWYVRRQRRRWRQLHGARRSPLGEADWLFFRLRPVNFPTARLAGFSRLIPLLAPGRAFERIMAPLERPGTTPRRALRALEALLSVRADGFWSRHVHFRGRGGSVAIGRSRIHDLVVNTVIPLALLSARRKGDHPLARSALALLKAMPGGARSSSLRRMMRRLGRSSVAGRLAEEGALRLHSRYCTRAGCSRCPAIRTSRRPSRGRTWTSRRR